ncbi:MAG: hypothetical protein N2490_04750 [Ignavibacteria bacterium]|nr:hypothetical protein [Ignavibacteria bacterium]
MKDVIISVIKEGERSHKLSELIDFCQKIAVTTINVSKYRNFIIEKSGLSINDLAIDVIADLFACEKGKYKFIDSCLKRIIDSKSEDEILAKLYALVIARTNQRIVELREECGELYFKIKKAVKLFLNRCNDYKKVFYKSTCYIYSCELSKLNPRLKEIPIEELLQLLFSLKFEKLSVASITSKALEIVNSQKKYLRAISEFNLYFVISEFYKCRLRDHLKDMENVHYIDIEVEI